MTVRHYKIWRGQTLEIPFVYDESQGSPAPTLTFTLAESRNNSTKLLTQDVEHVEGDPLTYRVLLTADDTDLEPGTYYWDLWRAAEGQPLAAGTITVRAVVRLP
jgi:hypothetical protein